MRKLASRFNWDLILERMKSFMVEDIYISRLIICMHQLEDKNRKQAEFRDKHGKRRCFYY